MEKSSLYEIILYEIGIFEGNLFWSPSQTIEIPERKAYRTAHVKALGLLRMFQEQKVGFMRRGLREDQ